MCKLLVPYQYLHQHDRASVYQCKNCFRWFFVYLLVKSFQFLARRSAYQWEITTKTTIRWPLRFWQAFRFCEDRTALHLSNGCAVESQRRILLCQQCWPPVPSWEIIPILTRALSCSYSSGPQGPCHNEDSSFRFKYIHFKEKYNNHEINNTTTRTTISDEQLRHDNRVTPPSPRYLFTKWSLRLPFRPRFRMFDSHRPAILIGWYTTPFPIPNQEPLL